MNLRWQFHRPGYFLFDVQQDEGESRYQVTAIIGHDNDIGVENLSAAAWIAGETSQAYNEIVTISMATSRAIGIGAYLVRLGQRVVQVVMSFGLACFH